jgi:hypothetical protein
MNDKPIITMEQMKAWLYTWVPKNHAIAEAIRVTMEQITTLQAENAALKAEVERFKAECLSHFRGKDGLGTCGDKCQWYPGDRSQCPMSRGGLLSDLEKAEAELEKARPLLESVMGTTKELLKDDIETAVLFPRHRAILCAALAHLRSRLAAGSPKAEIRHACVRCFGAGVIQRRPTTICPACNGTGQDPRFFKPAPPKVTRGFVELHAMAVYRAIDQHDAKVLMGHALREIGVEVEP